MHSAARRPGRPLVRVPRALAWAAIVGWTAYLLAAQALLWTPLLRRLVNAESPAIHLEYRRAWSAWPGRVHVEGLRLTSQDRAVQWQLDVDSATAALALWQLPRRMFHATRIRAQGVSFALRRRIRKPELTADRVHGLPLIAGLDPLPVAEEGPEDDLPDWRYKLFTVWLEDVAASSVRSIWVDRARLEGNAQVGGAFYLKPIRSVSIAPAELRGDSLALSYGGATAVEDLRGRLELSLGPFDPRGATRQALAGVFDLDSEGAGQVAGVDFLSGAASLPLHGGRGPLRFHLRVRRGVAQPGSEAAAQVLGVAARAGQLPAALRLLSASFDVRPGAPSRLRLEGRDAALGASDAVAARVSLARLLLEGEAPDLGGDSPVRSASLDVRGGRMGDARLLAAALGIRGARIDGGHGAFALHLDGPPARLAGWARASVAAGRATVDGMTFQGDLSVDAAVRDLDPWRGGDLSGLEVRVDQARVLQRGGEEDAAPGWWARISASHARLRLGPAPMLDGDVVARCRDARPLVGLYVRRADLPGFVSGLFSMDGLSVRSSVALGEGHFALRDLVASGQGASVRATYLATAGRKDGAALLTVGGLPVGVGLGDGDGGIHLLGPGDWFSEQQSRLQAEVGTPAQAQARRAATRARARARPLRPSGGAGRSGPAPGTPREW
jgi:hypothetical protein